MSAVGTKAQVTKGAKFLDEKVPEWAGKINKKKLKMASNQLCVLGQLAKDRGYKGNEAALSFGEDLGLTEAKVASHGFEAEGTDEADAAHAEFWKAEIDKRLPVEEKSEKKSAKKKVGA